MDQRHLRSHLDDLRARIGFLRAMQPDNPSYRLWLGDVIELVNLQWGVDSPQMAALRGALSGATGRSADGEAQREAYLARLSALDGVLERLLRGTGEPVQFLE